MLSQSQASVAVFCLLLGVSSDYAQPITGQVTEVTCPVVVDTKLTLSDPSHILADSSSSGESVRLPFGEFYFVYFLFSFVVYVICFV